MPEQDPEQPQGEQPREPARTSADLAMQSTPNAERYVLEADKMRRRQLRSALLHGSRRNWREHRRSWPGVVVGVIVVAVIIAALAVVEAFQKTTENQREQEEQQSGPGTSQPVPAPTGATGRPDGTGG